MNITDHPEFRLILEEAYGKAYSHGQQDERERCAKIAEGEFMNHPRYGHISATPEDRKFCDNIAEKIRSGK